MIGAAPDGRAPASLRYGWGTTAGVRTRATFKTPPEIEFDLELLQPGAHFDLPAPSTAMLLVDVPVGVGDGVRIEH